MVQGALHDAEMVAQVHDEPLSWSLETIPFHQVESPLGEHHDEL